MFENFDFDDIFNFLRKSNNIEFDWEEAKKKGRVTETEEIRDGVKTITKTFTDENGYSYTLVSSAYVGFEEKISNQKQIANLEAKIKEAVEKEEFEKAAELRDQKNKLK